jgi:hypothetical protein
MTVKSFIVPAIIESVDIWAYFAAIVNYSCKTFYSERPWDVYRHLDYFVTALNYNHKRFLVQASRVCLYLGLFDTAVNCNSNIFYSTTPVEFVYTWDYSATTALYNCTNFCIKGPRRFC